MKGGEAFPRWCLDAWSRTDVAHLFRLVRPGSRIASTVCGARASKVDDLKEESEDGRRCQRCALLLEKGLV